MYEWATKAVGKLNIVPQLIDKVCLATLANHKATLPTDLRSISMIAFQSIATNTEELTTLIARLTNLENTLDNPALSHMENPTGLVDKISQYINSSTGWKPLRLTTSPFSKANSIDDIELYVNPEVSYEYAYNGDNTITSTLREGLLLIAYKAYPCVDGDMMIPDNEDYKEAITHYCLYRFYTTKAILSEEAAYRERDWHLARFHTLAMKARNLNLPDIDTLENIGNYRNRLYNRKNYYDMLFSNMGYKEKET